MALETNCSTPGVTYDIHIAASLIEIDIYLGQNFDLLEPEAIHLERTIHNALALALTPLFARTEQQKLLPQEN